MEEYQHQIYGYECPIKNVTGSANVKIQNKNLFNPNGDFENGVYGLDGVFAPNDSWRCITISCKQGDILTRSGGTWGGNVTFWENNVFVSGINSSSAITIPSGVNEVKFACRYPFSGDEQIEQGSTATSYVQHQEQNLPFIFAEGQRAMQGTELKDDGIHNKHKQKIFDGTEYWLVDGDNMYIILENAKGYNTPAICTHFIYTEVTNNNYGYFKFANSSTNLIFFKAYTEHGSIANWKAWLAQQYANGTPVIVEYELADSALEDNIISYNQTQQSQYNAIKNARSFDDQTNFSSTSTELGFNMDVVAVADANKVIDKELQEIKSAVIALGGDLNV